ncbi:helix-turn-helix transcriptional regulator [Streptomyces antibioticus]|uniref:helix-turn-helix transcriptional regulator n=1 Tax=Streptomyces antibioticus TaxID=1890 RepID=UPI0036B367C8
MDPQRLTRRRVKAGLSQNDLAEAIGVSKQLVSAVSLGKASFSPRKLATVADVLGCDIEDLLPVDEARDRVRQFVDLVSVGTVTVGPQDLGKVAEILGCDLADLPAEDLATVAGVLGCDIKDLLPEEDTEPAGIARRTV